MAQQVITFEDSSRTNLQNQVNNWINHCNSNQAPITIVNCSYSVVSVNNIKEFFVMICYES